MVFERRQYPRTETVVPATITMDGGAQYVAIVCNVSCAGLQLAFDRETAAAILPASVLSTPLETVVFSVAFELAAPDGTAAGINVRCKVLGTTRLAENLYRLSVHYQDIDTATTERITRFISAGLALA